MEFSKHDAFHGETVKRVILGFMDEQFFDPIFTVCDPDLSSHELQTLREVQYTLKEERRMLGQSRPGELLRTLDSRLRSHTHLDSTLRSLDLPTHDTCIRKMLNNGRFGSI